MIPPTGTASISPPPENFFRRRQLLHPVRDLNPFLNSEVQVRKHIEPAQSKHEEHLRAPASEPLHLRESRNDFVVGQLVQRLDRQRSVQRMLRKISDVARFLVR
jgi:hypothetical protein